MKHLSLKLALFGAVFFLPVVISGCFLWKRCPCEDEPDTFYRITNFKLESYFYDWETYKYTDVFLYFKSDVEYYAQNKSLGLGGLYATPPCHCYKGTKGSKERLKDIAITSNRNYQNTYLAGTNLSPLISLQNIVTVYPSLNDSTMYQKQKVQDFIAKKYDIPVGFYLSFNEAPTQDKKHIFTIRYELDNGEVYTYTTPEITFQ